MSGHRVPTPVVVAQGVPDVHAGDVPVGVVEVHQVGEHLPQRPRLRVGSHQGDQGPDVLQQARRDRMPFSAVRVEDVLADPAVLRRALILVRVSNGAPERSTVVLPPSRR
jgi:hypothetical protein